MAIKTYGTRGGSIYESTTGKQRESDFRCDCEGVPLPPTPPPVRVINEDVDINVTARFIFSIFSSVFGLALAFAINYAFAMAGEPRSVWLMNLFGINVI